MNTPEENRKRVKRLSAEAEQARAIRIAHAENEMFDRIAAFLGQKRSGHNEMLWRGGDYWDAQERKMKRLPRQYLLPSAKSVSHRFDPRITPGRTPGIASARRHDRGRNRIERRG